MPDTANQDIHAVDPRTGQLPRPAMAAFNYNSLSIDSILNNLTQGIRIIDRNCVVLYINQSFSELSGVRPGDAAGRKCSEVFKSPFCNTGECRLAQVMAGHSFIQAEIERVKPDGSRIPCFVTAFPLTNQTGELIGIMESFRDITGRKELLAQVKESEDRYRALVELGTEVGEAIVMLQDTPECEAAQVYMSEQWLKITGYTRQEIQDTSFVKLLPEKDRAAVLSRYRRRMSGEVIPGLFEMTVMRKGGKRVPLEITGAASSYNNKPAVVVYIRDITARKQSEEKVRKAEESLKRHQEHLEEVVRERTARLMEAEKRLNVLLKSEQKLRRQLEIQMKQRVEFTRAMVHELKTPLTPLLGASDLLNSHLSEQPWSTLAAQAYKGATDLNRRIDELMDITRDEIGTLKLKVDTIDARELVRDVAVYVSPSLSKKGQVLALNAPKPLPPLTCDPNRLRQVLLNLLDNAIKHTPPATNIYMSVTQQNSHLLFRVKDTGQGIPRESLRRVFKPYARLDSDREHFSGLGLGLALCKTFVELHHGRIWVTSSEGKGSCFSFTIPLARPDSGRQEP